MPFSPIQYTNLVVMSAIPSVEHIRKGDMIFTSLMLTSGQLLKKRVNMRFRYQHYGASLSSCVKFRAHHELDLNSHRLILVYWRISRFLQSHIFFVLLKCLIFC